MENRVRDLEHIQEKEPDEQNRRIGMVILAVLTVTSLTFAMGVVVGRAAHPTEEKPKNRLVELDHIANLTVKDEQTSHSPPRVNAEELTFPIALSEQDDRPEVAAALEAAEAEEAELKELSNAESFIPDNPAGKSSADDRLPDVLPAATGAGSVVKNLRKTAKYDPLVTAAIQKPTSEKQAPTGKDGEFTLQVISYQSPEPAQAFANGLRARGHQAFVISADIPGRGRFYRVRIGPFKSKWKAQIYQQKFEEAERMSTFVVQRVDHSN